MTGVKALIIRASASMLMAGAYVTFFPFAFTKKDRGIVPWRSAFDEKKITTTERETKESKKLSLPSSILTPGVTRRKKRDQQPNWRFNRYCWGKLPE